MRTLYYVPTLHAPGESLEYDPKPPPDPAYAKRMERNNRLIIWCWRQVRRQLDGLIDRGMIDPARLHLFCDGVPHPISHHPEEQVLRGHEKSPAFGVIRHLKRRGARLRGTEQVGLLMFHGWYIMHAQDDPTFTRDPLVDRMLIDIRDGVVADRVARALPDGDVGVLFMGASHRADENLARIAPVIRIIRITYFQTLARWLDREVTP